MPSVIVRELAAPEGRRSFAVVANDREVRVCIGPDEDGRDCWTARVALGIGAPAVCGEGDDGARALEDARLEWEAPGDDVRAFVPLPWTSIERALRDVRAFR